MSRGHVCDNCERALADDDFVEYRSWDYECHYCGFKYRHSGDLQEQLGKFRKNNKMW
jgi:DNA-directed RNA polymerase subunit RPC12/RpoP